uniref:F-box domain-containing protein n=1 Tax=Steinernema glaseri TaxID=37863 RepID=A0A1I7Y7H1_9BILA
MENVPFDFINRVVALQKSSDISALRTLHGNFGAVAEEHHKKRFDCYFHFKPLESKCFAVVQPEPREGCCLLTYAEDNAKYIRHLEINMAMVERRGQREVRFDDSVFRRLGKLARSAAYVTLELGNRGDCEDVEKFSNIATKLVHLAPYFNELSAAVGKTSRGFEALASKVLTSDRLRAITIQAPLWHKKFIGELQTVFFKASCELLIIENRQWSIVPGIVDKWCAGNDRYEKKFVCAHGNPNVDLSERFKRQFSFNWKGYDYPQAIGDLQIPPWTREQIEDNIQFEYNPTARFYCLEHPKIPHHFACLTLVIDLDNILDEFDDVQGEFEQLGRDEDDYSDFLKEKVAAMGEADFASRSHFYYLFFC